MDTLRLFGPAPAATFEVKKKEKKNTARPGLFSFSLLQSGVGCVASAREFSSQPPKVGRTEQCRANAPLARKTKRLAR